jgi:hypothetical protein
MGEVSQSMDRKLRRLQSDSQLENSNQDPASVSTRYGVSRTEEMCSPSNSRLIYINPSRATLHYQNAMQRIAHSLSCLVLAFALILTGPGGAGPAKGAMQIELCAEDAASLVWIDAEGNPVPPGLLHAKCLDCLLFSAPLPNLADGLLTINSLPVAPGLTLPVSRPTHPVAHLRPIPRGPPVVKGDILRLMSLRPDFRSLKPLAILPIDFYQVLRAAKLTDPRTIL